MKPIYFSHHVLQRMTEKRMKITYDPQVDAAYIYLTEQRGEVTTVQVNDRVLLDYGGADELVGIEILDASQVLGFDRQHPQITVDRALAVCAA